MVRGLDVASGGVMDCFRVYIEELAQRIRAGEYIGQFSNEELHNVQEYALDVRDIALYDKISEYFNKSKR